MTVAKIVFADVLALLERAGADVSEGFEGVHFGPENFTVIHEKEGNTLANQYCYNDGIEHA